MVRISKRLNGSGVRPEPTALSQSLSLGTFFLRKNSSSHPLVWRDRGTMDMTLNEHKAKSIRDWHPLFCFYYIESKKFLRDRAIPRIALGTQKW
ncbi:hypothetical protein Oscil6304_0060 [Oscillatoria acuminata PCC 6304]|uniref:Uncharacterized protein n=1 Tax=Oscillatoria acuminata PCC 6304 TaxID=56110 RepID=K9TCV8_9CYAN|nr:hypothetical protein Oscil6304_0060 [Oscillatoria acuminata PCC 6304]